MRLAFVVCAVALCWASKNEVLASLEPILNEASRSNTSLDVSTFNSKISKEVESSNQFTSPCQALAYFAAVEYCTKGTPEHEVTASLAVLKTLHHRDPGAIYENTTGDIMRVIDVLSTCTRSVGIIMKSTPGLRSQPSLFRFKILDGNKMLLLPKLTLRLLRENDIAALELVSKYELIPKQRSDMRIHSEVTHFCPFVTPALIVDQLVTKSQFYNAIVDLANVETRFLVAQVLSSSKFAGAVSIDSRLSDAYNNETSKDLLANVSKYAVTTENPHLHPLDFIASCVVNYNSNFEFLAYVNSLGHDGQMTVYDRALVALKTSQLTSFDYLNTLYCQNTTLSVVAPVKINGVGFNVFDYALYISSQIDTQKYMDGNQTVFSIYYSDLNEKCNSYNAHYIYGVAMFSKFVAKHLKVVDGESNVDSNSRMIMKLNYANIAHCVGKSLADSIGNEKYNELKKDITNLRFPCSCFGRTSIHTQNIILMYTMFGHKQCYRSLYDLKDEFFTLLDAGIFFEKLTESLKYYYNYILSDVMTNDENNESFRGLGHNLIQLLRSYKDYDTILWIDDVDSFKASLDQFELKFTTLLEQGNNGSPPLNSILHTADCPVCVTTAMCHPAPTLLAYLNYYQSPMRWWLIRIGISTLIVVVALSLLLLMRRKLITRRPRNSRSEAEGSEAVLNDAPIADLDNTSKAADGQRAEPSDRSHSKV